MYSVLIHNYLPPSPLFPFFSPSIPPSLFSPSPPSLLPPPSLPPSPSHQYKNMVVGGHLPVTLEKAIYLSALQLHIEVSVLRSYSLLVLFINFLLLIPLSSPFLSFHLSRHLYFPSLFTTFAFLPSPLLFIHHLPLSTPLPSPNHGHLADCPAGLGRGFVSRSNQRQLLIGQEQQDNPQVSPDSPSSVRQSQERHQEGQCPDG